MGLIYNGIDLGAYCLTQSISQGPEFDPSHTDQLYTAIRIRCQSIVNTNLVPALDASESPAATIARIRHLLTAPRRPITFTAAGNLMIDLPDGLDDANGPFPDTNALTITRITPASFLISFAITLRITDCASLNPLGVLSLRWSESATIDANWLTVKRRQGLLILSSRSTTAPDDYRAIVTPGIDLGFRREQAQYVVDPTGLRFRFSFTDREMMKSPPPPALRMRGRMVESLPVRGSCAIRRGQISLALHGPKCVSAQDLLASAIQVALARLSLIGVPTTSGSQIVVGGTIEEALDDCENVISLVIEWIAKPTRSRSSGLVTPGSTASPPTLQDLATDALPINPQWVGQPIAPNDPCIAIAPPTRGTTEAVIAAAALLGDPCGQQIALPGAPLGGSIAPEVSPANPSIAVREISEIDTDDSALYADSDLPGIYEHYSITAHYRDHSGFQLLPPANDGGDCFFPQLHGAYTTCRIEWVCICSGGPPTIPACSSTEPNAIYLEGGISARELELLPDGVNFGYKLAGWQLWGFRDRNLVNITAPVPPFIDFSLGSQAAPIATANISETISLLALTNAANPFTGDNTMLSSSAGGDSSYPSVNP